LAIYYVDGAVGNDTNPGTAPGAGNAWATIGHAATTATNGDLVWIKASATYSVAAAITFNASDSYTGRAQFVGYTSTTGDNGMATVQASAGSFSMFSVNSNGVLLQNFLVDGNSQTSIRGIDFTSQYNAAFNCKVINCTNTGINFGATDNHINQCEVTACSSAAAVLLGSLSNIHVHGCWIHNNSITGLDGSLAEFNLSNCIFSNNSGATSDGVICQFGTAVRNCIFHGNGRDGLRITVNYVGILPGIRNNIFSANGGYGINMTSAPLGEGALVAVPEVDYNAFWTNTTAPRNNMPAGTHDVTLSGNPYVNSAGNNFQLNNTAGAGAACRAAGYPGAFPGGTMTGYVDIGTLQHQDSGGSAGMLFVPGMAGGMES